MAYSSDNSPRDGFSGKLGIIAAAAGSAVGLGNIWRFPYVAGENGGGAFLLIYMIFVLLIGVPVMLSEFSIGRAAQANPFGAFRKLNRGKPFIIVGLMGIIAAFFILAFYSTVAGWTLEYVYQSVLNSFAGKSSEELGAVFNDFKSSTFKPVMWQILFMFLTAIIVFAGVQKGIEKYSKILMPMLFVILLVLCVNSLTLTGASQGLEFLFKPDFSKINAKVILEALGQAFFSLSIGMGVLITYGSYIQKKDNLSNISVQVSLADSAVAILAGVAIFPAVFAFGINPAEGEGLVFMVLPNIFQQMAGGYFFSILFFVLLAIAALTSSISVLEVVVASLVEELKMKRIPATILSTVSITAFGILCTLSWSYLKGISIFGKSIFGILDYSASNVLLPLGGFLIVIYLGWFMGYKEVKNEISNENTLKVRLFSLFMFILRFIAPIAIFFVFLNGLGILKF